MKQIESVIDGPFRNGVITNMPREEYNEACGLNPSSICQPSPKHIKHAYEKPYTESSDPQLLGTIVHTLCWEPHKFDDVYAIWTGGRRYGKEWNAFQEEHEGFILVKQDMVDEAARIGAALVADPMVKELASEGIAETAVFTDEHGLQCRGLIDWVNTATGTMVDLKVCHSIEAHTFGKSFVSFGYGMKMALYRAWFQRESGKSVPRVKLICVESKAPYDVAVVPIPPVILDDGYHRAMKKIEEVRECIESGNWPGIARGEEYDLHLPAWAMDDQEVELV